MAATRMGVVGRHGARWGLVVCLGVAGLSAAASAVPAYAAGVAPTCFGEPATLVGSNGSTITGTEGADVIVTDGAADIKALGGDDLICVTGDDPNPGAEVWLNTGSGSNRVQVDTQYRHEVIAFLAGRHDTFRGGAEKDDVGEEAVMAGVRTGGDDVIETGGGDDNVDLEPDRQAHDIVRLGPGDDRLQLDSQPGRSLDGRGGRGSDDLVTWDDSSAPSWLIDNVRQQARRRGRVVFGWTSFERFETSLHDTDFRGSSKSETFTADLPGRSIRMGPGRDTVDVGLPLGGRAGRGLDGGRGRDRLNTFTTSPRARADMRADRITIWPGQRVTRFRHFEAVNMTGRKHLTMVGTSGDNLLRGAACDLRIQGRGGNDTIEAHSEEFFTDNCLVRLRAPGGPGADRLIGAPGRYGGDDQLLGGPGRDYADGNQGQDLCRAEVEVDCED